MMLSLENTKRPPSTGNTNAKAPVNQITPPLISDINSTKINLHTKKRLLIGIIGRLYISCKQRVSVKQPGANIDKNNW